MEVTLWLVKAVNVVLVMKTNIAAIGKKFSAKKRAQIQKTSNFFLISHSREKPMPR